MLEQEGSLRECATLEDETGLDQLAESSPELRLGSLSDWLTHRPNRFSVQKLVLLSGSVSARSRLPSRRDRSALEATASISAKRGRSGTSPRASIPALSM